MIETSYFNSSIISVTHLNEEETHLLIRDLISEWYSQSTPYAKLHSIIKHKEVLKIYFPFQELLNDASKKYTELGNMLHTLLQKFEKIPSDVQAVLR